MALGEGSRKIGEMCWTHVQCRRSQENSYCGGDLRCKCDSALHNINGRCSRNYWEDLGLQNWQLLLIALITTLFFLAVFVGCLYYFLIKIVRKYRRTRPSGEPAPADSFKGGGGTAKRNNVARAAVPGVKVAAMRHSIRRHSQELERTRTQLRREMDILKEKEEEEEEEKEGEEEEEDEETTSGTSTEGSREVEDDIVPASSIRPLTKFILPLHYSHSHGSGRGRQRHNLRRSSSFGSWSLSSWEMEPLEAGLDWWPARKQFRQPVHGEEPTKTLRPLLLHASASESEEELA